MRSQIVVNNNVLLIELYVIFAKNGKPELVQGNATKNKENNTSCRMVLQHDAGEKQQQQVEDFTFGDDAIIPWQ